MASQKESTMSLRMKGAFGKMKSGKIQFKMTKPTLNTNSKVNSPISVDNTRYIHHTYTTTTTYCYLTYHDIQHIQPSKQFKSMFDRFNKNNDDKKWTDILSGTWEIELPIGEFLSAPPPSSNEDSSSDKKESAINDPNSVSNRQAPMVQISEDLKVICIPLSTDIANPHIHQNYLSSKSINTNATRIKVEGKDNVIKLVLDTDSSSSTQSTTDESQENNNNANANNNNNSSTTNEDKEQVVLEGTINTDSFVIRWSDGSSWSKQGVGNEDEEEETATPSHTNESNDSKPAANKEYEQQLSSLRSQLEIAREKEKMAKSQSQATMGQYADLGQQYAKLTTEHEQLQREHSELSGKHSKMSEEFEAMKAKLDEQTAELERVKGDFQFSRQQEQQMKLNKMKKENEEYIKSINLQQESILSLQDQLQTAQRAGRQYTKTIEDLEARMSESEKQKSQAKAALNEMNAKFMSGQTQLDDQKHKEQILNEKHAKEVRLLTEKHHQEIEKLERGFQETLTQNEKKMQELQTLRNNYEKKNASLTKDVKKLIIQLEKQAKSFSANSVSNQINLGDIGDDNEALKKLRDENAQLSEELIRKSQSLVDALRALAEFHQNPQAVTKSITSGLSHAQQYMFQQQQLQHQQQQPNINAHGVHMHDNNGYEQKSNDHHNAAQIDHAAKVPSSYKEVSDQLKMSMEQEMKSPGNNPTSPALTARSSASASNNSQQQQQAQQAAAAGQRVVIGATYGPNDISQQIKQQQAMHSKLGRLRNRFGSKMKEQIQRMQQQMQQQQIQRHKSTEQETLNELNAKSVIKETEKVMMITKTKQQLNAQCVELQGLANELSSTIEQKEEILDSLRFANTYLGKRVICLEKLLKMQPGDPIKNQDELIRDAINITPRKDNNDQEEEEDDAQRAGLQLEMNVSRRVNGNANEEDNDDDAVDVKVIESEARNSDTPELSMATMTQTVDERKKQNQNEEDDDDNDGVRVPQHIQVVLNEELNVENVKKEDGITPVAKDVIVEEVEAKSKQEDKDETEEEEEANKDEDRDQEEPAAQQQDEEERLNSKDNDDEVEQEEVEHVHVQKEDTTQKVGDEHDGNAEHARNEQLDIDDDEREEEEEDEQIEQEEEEANEDKNAQSVDVEVNPTDDPSDNEEKEADPEPEIIKQDEQKSKEEEQDKVEQEEEEEEERNDAAMNVVEEEKPNEEETQKAAQQNEADDNDPQLDSSEQEQ